MSEVRESCRVKQLREMAVNNQHGFLQFLKTLDEENQMWRSIYHTWNFRHASARTLVPRDVDEVAVDAKINDRFVESMVNRDEAIAIAKEMAIDISAVVRSVDQVR